MGLFFKDDEKPFKGSLRPMGSHGDTNKALAKKLAKGPKGTRDKRDIDEGELYEGTKKFSFWD